jgi:hypothetical protein
MALGCNIAVTVCFVIEIITFVSILLAVIFSAGTGHSGTGYYSNSGSGTFDCRSYRCTMLQ